jgi:HAE1 family hydrophobic/amphiphilic exporter-1
MLVGVVVNNAILMLDYANQLVRENGMGLREALIEACPTKLRPVIMSTLALILGMLPMAMGMGDAGKEMRTPMGVVSVGGLIVSTVLTLWVIPAITFALTRKKNLAAHTI